MIVTRRPATTHARDVTTLDGGRSDRRDRGVWTRRFLAPAGAPAPDSSAV